MHATLILLNGYFTLRTILSVKLDPNISVIISDLNTIMPLIQHVTVNRPVCLLQALKAPVIATLANDIGWFHRWVLYCIATVWGGAPLCNFVDIYERFLEVVSVLIVISFSAILLEQLFWDN